MINADRLYDSKSGKYKIISRSKNMATVKFVETGYQYEVFECNARVGKVRDPFFKRINGVGYVGVGNYKTSVSGNKSRSYTIWISMLNRCYSEKCQKRQPTYIGCKVCEEWHNYQNFAKWFNENHPKDGKAYQLDKDIIGNGKEYSPDNCVFVTCKENVQAKPSVKPVSVIDRDGNIYTAQSQNDLSKKIGVYQSSISNLVNGKLKETKGYKLCKI